MARRHVTVALNGDGGDESFAGYPRYVANLAAARLDRLPRRSAARWRRPEGASASGTIDSWRSRVRRLAETLPLDGPTATSRT